MIGETALGIVMGAGARVPVWGGSSVEYIDLDCSATTPVFDSVWKRLAEILPLYGSVHRGAGYKSSFSTELYEESMAQILRFAGGTAQDALLLSTNTTTAINHLARRLGLGPNEPVLVSDQEHSSNLLPWRKEGQVVQGRSLQTGDPDLEDWEVQIKQQRVRLVAVTAASNVTGRLFDVRSIARLAHEYGAKIVVDASQSAGHRRIYRGRKGDPDYIDFIAFSSHKMYAPFGVGVLVAPLETIRDGWPDAPGGGTVRFMEGQDMVWARGAAREQGGTPNFIGTVAVAEASRVLEKIGFDNIAEHESGLVRYAAEIFPRLPRVKVYRSFDAGVDSLPIFPFSVEGIRSPLVGAYLGVEKGIGVRTGYLSQYAHVNRLLGLSRDDRQAVLSAVAAGDMGLAPGVVRASAGIASTISHLKALGESLRELVENGPRACYSEQRDGTVEVQGWPPAQSEFREAS